MFKVYRKKGTVEMRPYQAGDDLTGVSISDTDKANGSPKKGDMIAHSPQNVQDMWLVSEKFFLDNYEEVVSEDDELEIDAVTEEISGDDLPEKEIADSEEVAD